MPFRCRGTLRLGGPPSRPQPEALHAHSGLSRMRTACSIAGLGSVLCAAIAVFCVSMPATEVGDLGTATITEQSDTKPHVASFLPQTRSSVRTPPLHRSLLVSPGPPGDPFSPPLCTYFSPPGRMLIKRATVRSVLFVFPKEAVCFISIPSPNSV